MSHAAYVFGGWAVTAAVLAVYAARVLRRERRLAAQVPEEDRRWA